MKSIDTIKIAAAFTVTILAATSATAAPMGSRSDVTAACMAEAKWPVFASHNFRNGSVKRRVQMLSGASADADQGIAICARLGRDDRTAGADANHFLLSQRDRFAPEAQGHLDRLASLFDALVQGSGTDHGRP